ncbi:MAG: hypothetical protein EOP60_07835 [Sphingomonadales bacterium]|nr:MAG: hypothetical protein EOP60_07835 [Sphingomonadales bacterium]
MPFSSNPIGRAGRWLRAEMAAHPVRFVLAVGALFTLAMVNVRLFAAPGPWWRGWADQKAYLESAQAFLALDLDPARHWYPLAYPLTGAPFAGLLAAPFVPVNIACFALAFAGFRKVALRLGVGSTGAVLLFLAATLLDPRIAKLWVEPWTTSLSAAAIWLSLGMVADRLAGEGSGAARAAMLGALLMLVPLVRPADAAVVAMIAPFALWRMLLRDLAAMAGAGLGLFATYAALHLAIYGARWSDYVLLSREYGLNFSDLPWKAYVLLVDPSAWFPGETGLLRTMPWLLIGAAGLLLGLATLRGAARALWLCLGLSALAYCAVLFAYVDLLPSGMWRYNNVHYFKWMLPLFALSVMLFVRWARAAPRRSMALIAALVLASCIRPDPVVVGPAAPARALRFAGSGAWTDIYMARSAISDARGLQRNFFEYHQVPHGSTQVIAVALKQPFAGNERWMTSAPAPAWPRGAPGHEAKLAFSPVPFARLGTNWHIAPPCWAWRCAALDGQTLAE